MSDTSTLTEVRTPTVYFIDDSATMREVIKIAFRKEKFNVITCADAASAMAQFVETAPDVVITDVIMPDKDGYEVCQFIKQHERFGHTPVILMSGVVNRMVAEKATAVSADELIRKPFQPHELILRVKGLLAPKSTADVPRDSTLAILPTLPALEVQQAPLAQPHALNTMFAPAQSPAASMPLGSLPAARPNVSASPGASGSGARATPESQKLRYEIRRLELLVKKLQAELEAERQYCVALESHLKSMQESE